MLAIRLESPGTAIYRQRRVGKDGRAFDLLKLRTMVTGAEHMGAGLAVNEGDPRITRVGAFLRRTSLDELPEPRQRPARRDGDRRPAADDPGPGRPVHRAPARPPRGQARHHRLGAGQRPRRAALARAHRARPLVRRAPLLAPRPADPAAHRADGPQRPRPLPRRAGGWREPPRLVALSPPPFLFTASARRGAGRPCAGLSRPLRCLLASWWRARWPVPVRRALVAAARPRFWRGPALTPAREGALGGAVGHGCAFLGVFAALAPRRGPVATPGPGLARAPCAPCDRGFFAAGVAAPCCERPRARAPWAFASWTGRGRRAVFGPCLAFAGVGAASPPEQASLRRALFWGRRARTSWTAT